MGHTPTRCKRLTIRIRTQTTCTDPHSGAPTPHMLERYTVVRRFEPQRKKHSAKTTRTPIMCPVCGAGTYVPSSKVSRA